VTGAFKLYPWISGYSITPNFLSFNLKKPVNTQQIADLMGPMLERRWQ